MDYFDLSDVLLREETVSARFPHRIEFFGFLVPGGRPHIPAHRRVDVPVFLLGFVLENGHCAVETELVSQDTRNALRAKASSVRLGLVSRHFYGLACLLRPQDAELLCDAFLARMAAFLGLLVEGRLCSDDLEEMDAAEARILKTAMGSMALYGFPRGRPRIPQ